MVPMGCRPQRTIAETVEISGLGIVTGAQVTVRLHPGAGDTGILFRRSDRPDSPAIPAHVHYVSDTLRRTTLGTSPNSVTVVEHLLAALAGMRIDNCIIELDGPEPPGLDGSALGFVTLLKEAGTVIQQSRRLCYGVEQSVVVKKAGATLALHPATGPFLRVSYLLNYGEHAAIAPQSHSETIIPESFGRELAPCRTFILENEAEELKQRGIGRHLSRGDILVFGKSGLIGSRLRFANEPARHKILDLVGDLSLCGFELAGHIVAYRSGHHLNVELACQLVTMMNSKPMNDHARKSA